MNQDCNKKFFLLRWAQNQRNVRRKEYSMKLIFVRHGRTYFNEIRLTQRWCDSPLSKTGQKIYPRVFKTET